MTVSGNSLVSVVVPVYNSEMFIEKTLDTVFSQTYKKIEVVVVDDGSVDRSIEILRAYRGNIIVVEQENGGPAAARNTGVKHASGDWIAFLDADDLWEPRKLELQLSALGGCMWSYTDSLFLGGVNDGKRDSDLNFKPSGDILESLVCGNFIGTSSVMVNREVFQECGGFDRNLRSIQDWDLWIRIASRYPISFVNEPLVKYRIHSASTSRSTRRTLPNHLKVIDKNFSKGGVAEHLNRLKRIAKASSMSICSQIAEEEGDYTFACRCAWGAFTMKPYSYNNLAVALKSTIKLVLHSLRLY